MIIRDKQDLRKCVKQCVRRAQVIETDAGYAFASGAAGVKAYMQDWTPSCDVLQDAFYDECIGSPFARKSAELLAALDAMQLPAHDLDKAESIIGGYDRDTYTLMVLDAMRARKVLIRVPVGSCEQTTFADDRLNALLVADQQLFAAGRYGIDYEGAAQRIGHALRVLRAKDIMSEGFDEFALRYCLIPVCEDEGAVLHVHVDSIQQMSCVLKLLAEHSQVRAVVDAEEALERELIKQAKSLVNVCVQLQQAENIKLALQTLGLRFIPYSSRADSPEGMLGGWVYAKEALWQTLYDAYLLMARAGYELTREKIEADVERLLCGNYEKLHMTEQ